MKFVKPYLQYLNEANEIVAVDGNIEDASLHKIRHFHASVQDLDDWLRNKIGETNPYKDTKMINGPRKGQAEQEAEQDKSLPYQDFQNGNSELIKNRYGR